MVSHFIIDKIRWQAEIGSAIAVKKFLAEVFATSVLRADAGAG